MFLEILKKYTEDPTWKNFKTPVRDLLDSERFREYRKKVQEPMDLETIQKKVFFRDGALSIPWRSSIIVKVRFTEVGSVAISNKQQQNPEALLLVHRVAGAQKTKEGSPRNISRRAGKPRVRRVLRNLM